MRGEQHVTPRAEIADLVIVNQAASANMPNRPERVKCAILSWRTLRAALEGKGEAVSTE
jgi:nitrogen fixation NifU-like protein